MMERFFLICSLTILVAVANASPKAAQLMVGSMDWKTFEVTRLSFSAPENLKRVGSLGIDSEVYRFETNDFYIVIDIGEYAQFNSSILESSQFKEELLRVKGIAARMVFYRSTAEACGDICGDFSDVYAIFFSPPEINTNISFSIYAKGTLDPQVPKRILQSIHFRN